MYGIIFVVIIKTEKLYDHFIMSQKLYKRNCTSQTKERAIYEFGANFCISNNEC